MPKFIGKIFLEFFHAFPNKVRINTLVKHEQTDQTKSMPQSFQYPGADQTDRSPWTRRLILHSRPQGSSLMPITTESEALTGVENIETALWHG